jgi:hypothetical protein
VFLGTVNLQTRSDKPLAATACREKERVSRHRKKEKKKSCRQNAHATWFDPAGQGAAQGAPHAITPKAFPNKAEGRTSAPSVRRSRPRHTPEGFPRMRAFVGESRWGTCGRRGAVVPGCAAEPATPGFVVKRLRRTAFPPSPCAVRLTNDQQPTTNDRRLTTND